ncbi:hypothetical protein SE336_15720 [Xanthomonas arboricola]|uniref:hypothetical protein n=1 Tax=Xanthomonas arboricola TaxID=56448 RepID=UPI0039F4BBCE
MHPLFHIQPEMIQRLDDAIARQLIARLCEADISRSGLPPRVFYGGDQRAADDGVDVEVACRPIKQLSEKLARSVAIVQVKAETKPFGPTRIKKEMAPKGELRPAIVALANDRGLYLIASTKENPSFKARAGRVEVMRDILASAGLNDQIEVEFYGAQEIASWVESHPPIGIWLRQVLGQPLVGWQGYAPWAYRETDIDREFILDEAGRVLIPNGNELATIAEAVAAIRRDLKSGNAVRLLGLSGMGKTRLAQALFDDRLAAQEPALSPNIVIYSDLGDRPFPTPEDMLGAVSQSLGETIMIIDNCGQETHNALVERKTKSSAKVGLLTIEYDIQDNLAPSTRAYKLDGASDDTIEKILRSRFRNLSGTDRDVIIRVSHGNARLALAIAETAPQSGHLSSLEDGELFRRLFHQRAETGNELLRCARAASLLYSFNGEDLEPGSELSILSDLADVSTSTFYHHMAEIRRRGLLQARGKMRAILPHAVGNHLANEGLQEISPTTVTAALFTDATPRVRASFGNRLSYLENSKEANKIVTSWLSNGGALSKISGLRDEEMLVFKRIAPLNPPLALAAVEQFLEDDQAGEHRQRELRDLSNLVNAIAYDANLFKRAVWALLRISLEHSEGSDRSGPRKNITSLFQIIYSGTHASTQVRATLVRELLSSTDDRVWQLGIDCLDAALQTLALSSSGTSRFGTRSRDYGWQPSSMDDQQAWFAEFLSVAGDFASIQDKRGEVVRSTIGRRARDLLHLDDSTINALVQLTPSFQTEDGWPEAWTAAKLLLRRTNIDEKIRSRVKMFAQAVAPRGLRQKVVAKLHSREIFDNDDIEFEKYEERENDAKSEAKAVGIELGANSALLLEMIPQIMDRGARGLTFFLGQGVATSHTDVPSILDAIGRLLTASDEQSISLIFVRGLMSGWSERSPEEANRFLDRAVRDPVWARWYSDLQTAVAFDSRALLRALEAIEHGVTPVEEFTWLGMGGTLASHPVAEFVKLLDSLAAKGPNGVRAAIDTLHMQVYSAKNLDASEKDVLGDYCLNFLLHHDWTELDIDQTMVEHELNEVVKYAVEHDSDFEPLKNLLDIVIKYRRKSGRYDRHSRGNFITLIMNKFPKECLSYLLDHPLLSKPEDAAELILIENHIDEHGNLSNNVSDEVIVDWVSEHPAQRAELAMRICCLEMPTSEEAALNSKKTLGTLQKIYDLAISKAEVIRALGSRLIGNSFSSREIPYMKFGIQMLESLPEPTSPAEIEMRNRVKEQLSQRIDWMSDMSESERREPEGFE